MVIRSYVTIMLPFYANILFWALRKNLGLKYPSNFCKQISFAAGVHGKPKRCRALKVTKALKLIQINTQSEILFLWNFCQTPVTKLS